MDRVYTSCLVFLTLQSFVSCQLMTDVDQILKDKLAVYNKAIRPVKNQSDTVNVNMTFGVIAVKGFDEVFERLSITGYMQLAWTDANLVWDPRDYNMVSNITTYESAQFWRPNIVNVNSADKLKSILSDWVPSNIHSDGTVYHYPGLDLSVMCKVNVLYYPFDKQTCTIEFIIWGFGDTQVHLLPDPNIGLQFYVPMGPWRITDTRVYSQYGIMPIFEIELRRQSDFLALNYVLPIIILAFLNAMVFFIPNESGERISYCLTVLLAIAVYMTLVSDNLPKTSEPMSIFGFFMFLILLLSVIITLATIASLRLYFRDEDTNDPRGSAWTKLYMFCACKKKRGPNTRSRHNAVHVEHEKMSGQEKLSKPRPIFEHSNELEENSRHKQKYIKEHAMRNSFGNYNSVKPLKREMNGFEEEETQPNTLNKTAKNDQQENEISWKDISIMLDMFFFALFILVLVIVTALAGLYIGLRPSVE